MNWVFHTADRKRNVDLSVAGDHPSVASTIPDITICRTGNPPVDYIGNLPRHLRQSETGIQDRVQAVPSIDNRGDIDHLAVWTDDAILVQEDLPMLVTLVPDRDLGDRDLRHLRDIFEAGDEFSDGDIARVEIRGIIRPTEQGCEVIGRGGVGEEDPVHDSISRRSFEDVLDVGTTVGTQAN
jgi:hypothetical protein